MKNGLNSFPKLMYLLNSNDKGNNDKNKRNPNANLGSGAVKNHPIAINQRLITKIFTLLSLTPETVLEKNKISDKDESRSKILCFKSMLWVQKGIQLKVVFLY